jgi:hypothetical protein
VPELLGEPVVIDQHRVERIYAPLGEQRPEAPVGVALAEPARSGAAPHVSGQGSGTLTLREAVTSTGENL